MSSVLSRGQWPTMAASLALAVALAAPADAQRRRDREVLEALEARVGVLERQIRADNVVALINAQDELRREIQALRDMMERLDQEQRRNAELRRSQFAVLEERLAALEAARLPRPPEGAANTGGQPPAPDEASASASDASLGPQAGSEPPGGIAAGTEENYQQARTLLGEGRYEAAATQFLRYLEAEPKGLLAANARYWLGEAFYVQGRYDEAAAAFSRVAADYPDSGKVPDALLKLGYTQDEMGDTSAAVLTLERVRQDFAGADAANLATLRLAQIEARPR
ncbi:MAG: tol-pal system protein YbgF [Gammaproteobacteria bacterium]|nr:tol-pal system protein YbgF [Gammaproteobacteria bacterium]MCY4339880.1 tol-pal system protein YbgF [Gammaproteobacteria bacterium]